MASTLIKDPETGIAFSISDTNPPTDTTAGSSVNGSATLVSGVMYQRIAGSWVTFPTLVNSFRGRFITGQATIPNGAATVSVASPAGVSNGDTVVATYNGDPGGTVTGIRAEVTGGNIVIDTIGGNVGGDTLVGYMVDTLN